MKFEKTTACLLRFARGFRLDPAILIGRILIRERDRNRDRDRDRNLGYTVPRNEIGDVTGPRPITMMVCTGVLSMKNEDGT